MIETEKFVEIIVFLWFENIQENRESGNRQFEDTNPAETTRNFSLFFCCFGIFPRTLKMEIT